MTAAPPFRALVAPTAPVAAPAPSLASSLAEIADDAEVLLASLSTQPKALLNQIIGALEEKFAAIDTPKIIYQVVRVLFEHIGWHSNRVWVCQLSIEGELAKRGVKGRSIKSIQRVYKILRDWGFVRKITDPEELLPGPGPHQCAEELRESEHRTDTYDLGGLRQLVKAILLGARPPLPVPPLDKGENQPDPFASSPEPPPISKPTLHNSSPPGEPPPGVSAGGPPPPLCHVGREKPAPKIENANQAPKGRYFQKSILTPLNSGQSKAGRDTVARGASEAIGEGVDGEAGEAGGAPSSPQLGARSATKAGTALLQSPEGGRAGGLTPEQTAMAEKLGKIPGMKAYWAHAVVRRHGVDFCSLLLLYGQEQGIRDGEPKGGGWYTNTIKNFAKGDGEFPDWMRKRAQIEEQWKQLQAEAAAIERERTPVVQAPGPVTVRESPSAASTSPVEAPEATRADLEALPEPERRDLLDRAFDELTDKEKGLPLSSRARLKSQGREASRQSNMVIERAVRLIAADRRRVVTAEAAGGEPSP